MRAFVSRLLGRSPPPDRPPSAAPDGKRAYVIGDIHGRLDLLDELLEAIAADATGLPGSDTYLVFLGDLIDRGPDSAGVVERLRTLDPARGRPVFLMGNHEEVLLRIWEGETRLIDSWFGFGGMACLRSYGVEVGGLIGRSDEERLVEVRRHVPAAHVEFLSGFLDTFRFGDYLLVHAGVRPNVPLDRQAPDDLRWIRDDFLDHMGEHGFVVVHGHTIAPEPEERHNRIGIDTGAWRTGRLTALVLEGTCRRYLVTDGEPMGRAEAEELLG